MPKGYCQCGCGQKTSIALKVYRVHKPWNGPAKIVETELEKEGAKFWTLKAPFEGEWRTKIEKETEHLFHSPEQALMGYMKRLSDRLIDLKDKMLPLERNYAEAKAMLLEIMEEQTP